MQVAAAACLSLLLVACATAPSEAPHAPAASDLPRHELIFARHADSERTDYDIWRMCGDGTQMASLVVRPGHQIQVDVSPDGSEILFAEKVDGAWDVFRKPIGRGDAVNVTAHPAADSEPSWSPDGRRIAFFSDRDAEKLELYVLDLESGALDRITNNVWYESGAAWMPDGRTILLTRFVPASEETGTPSRGDVYAIDVETSEERQLTDLGGYSGGLSVSPDGELVTFHRSSDGGVELWIMRPDGSGARALTDTFIDEYSPEWSPDGRWIVFAAGKGHDGMGTFDLWIMRPDGSERRLLNAAANTEAWATWRPGDHFCR